MEETRSEEYIVVPEREVHRRKERKSEVQDSFGKPNEFLMREVEGYLSEYRASARMIEMNRYEREFFAYEERSARALHEETENYLLAKMYAVRAFVLSIPDCDEKLFLYYHYIHYENMTRCAELLGISRATVYRLRDRALRSAARQYLMTRKEAL